MFKFTVDTGMSVIFVELIDGNPGPCTTMYYPRDGQVEILGDTFKIDGELFTPKLEDSRIDKDDIIRVYK